MSLLSWERGLKFVANGILVKLGFVAPLVGAWIEIEDWLFQELHVLGRSSRGSVD